MSDSPTPPKTGQRFPIGYTDEASFIVDVRNIYHKDVESDRHNMEPAREDIQFVIGHQWDAGVKARRDRLRKPVITVNRMPAFVAQFVGAWLQSDVTIKVLPARGGSREIAEIRQGIIRTITRTQAAKRALHKAMESAYVGGIGNFKIDLAETDNDVFTRDIVIQTIDDPFAVIWDRASYEPTGSDAQHCFVSRYMTKEDFKRAYPNAKSDSGWAGDDLDNTVMTGHAWEIDDMVKVVEFWQMRKEPVTLGLEADTGDVIDLAGVDESEYSVLLALDDEGNPMVRETFRSFAEAYVLTSSQVLEGPYRLDIPRLPVFRVEGWSLQEASVKFRWGFVRHAKDSQRLHNYWRSTIAEELMKSPASKWLIDDAGDTGGLAEQFNNQHNSGSNVLRWNSSSGGAKPEFIGAPPINGAVLTEANMTVQDIKDVTNKHEASLGQVSNEVSGKAITARQRVSELGDVIYIENMNAAIAEAGRVINALIPVVYDTNRTIKITGDDDVELLQEINGTAGDKTPDVTIGKYDITYTTGPSYSTKRQEAVEVMLTLMNTMPQVGNVIADIIVRNMDIPGASEIEERLASLLPPGMVNPERLPARRREAVAQQQQQAQQQAQQQQQMQQVAFTLQMEELKAKINELTARAERQGAQAALAESMVGVDQAKVEVAGFAAAIKAAQVEVDAEKAASDIERFGMEFAMNFNNSREQALQRNAPGAGAVQPQQATPPTANTQEEQAEPVDSPVEDQTEPQLPTQQ